LFLELAHSLKRVHGECSTWACVLYDFIVLRFFGVTNLNRFNSAVCGLMDKKFSDDIDLSEALR
jgi:hypothetical protein